MESQVSPEEIMADFAGPQSVEDFPPEVRIDVEGLMWLGYIEDTFSFCGHEFVIRTLRGDEELLAALVSKEYLETLGQAKAWTWAQIGLMLVAVDGEQGFCPQSGPDKRDYARARYQYCITKWFWPVAEFIWLKYLALLERQKKALEAMENLSIGSLATPTPSPSSSTDREDSEEGEEIMEFLETPDSPDSKLDS